MMKEEPQRRVGLAVESHDLGELVNEQELDYLIAGPKAQLHR
jgi:hypothetical protein